MGGRASKARSLPQVASRVTTRDPASEAPGSGGHVTPPPAVAAPAAAPPSLEEDKGVVQNMNQLIGGIQTKYVDIYHLPQIDLKYARPVLSKEDRAALLRGRLAAPALKQLLDERTRAACAGQELPVAELASKYGVDEVLLGRVLRYSSTPAVEQASDGRLVGRWPAGGSD